MTGRSGRRIALCAAALIVLAQGAALAASTSAPNRITKPVNATKDDINPGRLYLAPALAIDPNNELHVAAAMTELRTKTCFFMRSSDGGRTWVRPDASPAPATYPFCNTNNRGSHQAQIAYGRNGNLYMAFPGWDAQDAGTRGNTSLIVARSSDFGNTWQPVVAVDNRGKQNLDAQGIRPVGGIAVDRKSGSEDVVYVTYASRQTNAAAPNAAPNMTSVVVSTDGGRKYSAPVLLPPTAFNDQAARDRALTARTTVPANPNATTTTVPAGSRAAEPNQVANFGGFEADVTVADDGAVYAAWPPATANITPGIPTGIMLSKSTDKGKTWTNTQAVPFAYTNDSFVKVAWTPGGGAQGTVHVFFPGIPRPEVAGYREIYSVRSTDGGKTFTPPAAVNPGDGKLEAGQYYPDIDVAPNGRLDLTWYDTRTDPGFRSNEVFYAYTNDDGKTWSKAIQISDQPIDRRLGVWSFNYDITTPPGIASADKYSVFGWDDTRNNDRSVTDNAALGGGAQDFYAVAAQFEAIGGGASKTAKIVVAGCIGLLAVGLVLLVVALAARSRTGAAPLGAKRAEKKKAEAPKPAKV